MVAHAIPQHLRDRERKITSGSKPAWSRLWHAGQPELHNDTNISKTLFLIRSKTIKDKLSAVLGAFTIYFLNFYSKHASPSPKWSWAGRSHSISPLSKEVEILGWEFSLVPKLGSYLTSLSLCLVTYQMGINNPPSQDRWVTGVPW